MTSFMDRDKLALLMQAFDDLHEETCTLLNRHGSLPAEGSPAAKELATYSDQELVLTAYAQADFLTEAASEHVASFRRTAVEPALAMAPWACVRAVIESSALASWLLDPSVECGERVKRSFAFRYEGVEQQAKLARAVGDHAALENSQKRMDFLEERALALGFTRVLDRKGNRIGVGLSMPPITALAGQVLDEEDTYRLLSAVAHAHIWALHQVGYLNLGKSLDDRPGMVSMKKAAKPLCFKYLARKAVDAYSRPIVYKATLFGWAGRDVEERMQFYRREVRRLAEQLDADNNEDGYTG